MQDPRPTVYYCERGVGGHVPLRSVLRSLAVVGHEEVQLLQHLVVHLQLEELAPSHLEGAGPQSSRWVRKRKTQSIDLNASV